MSLVAITLVWDRFPGSGSELLAMLALADWCNDEGASLYPSIRRLAGRIRTSESQARRVLHGLIDAGWVDVIGNHNGGAPGTTRNYQLNVSRLHATPRIHATPSTGATPRMDARDGSHGRAPTAGMGASQTVSRTTIEPLDPLASAGDVCARMREMGVLRVNPSHANLLAALSEGVLPQTLIDTAAEFLPTDADCFSYVLTVARKRHARGAATVPTEGADHANRPIRGESLVDRATRRLKAIHAAHPEAFDDAADQDAG